MLGDFIHSIVNTTGFLEILEFCPECKEILPLYQEKTDKSNNINIAATRAKTEENLDYCAILGVSPEVVLHHSPENTDILRNLWLNKLRHNHPDRYIRSTPIAQDIARQNSALCNTAYEILSDTRTKIAYFLKKIGYDIDNPKVAASIQGKNPELAMKSFVIQENCMTLKQGLSAAVQKGDEIMATEYKKLLADEKNSLEAQIAELFKSIAKNLLNLLQNPEYIAQANDGANIALKDYSNLLFIERALDILRN
jgi:hypothetical protein